MPSNWQSGYQQSGLESWAMGHENAPAYPENALDDQAQLKGLPAMRP
ncbi:MAG: hypothetical protein H6656_06535 [Ardenticatenaceae bacterium]|nr:hypothetical protein [Ardenticatenaceae bacterium]